MSDENEPVGKVTDYFWKRDTVRIEVLDGSLEAGETVDIRGEYTDVTVELEEMTVDDEPVDAASEGDVFAMPLSPKNRVVLGDLVYRAES